MDLWVIWIVAAAGLGVGEILTAGFFLAPFALGALLAGLVNIAGVPDLASAVVFLLASVAFLVFVRPVATRHLRQPPHLRIGTAALVGQTGMVIERVANDEGLGAAKIDGEVWTARSFDEDRTIEPGTKVRVIEIRGATALVD